MYITLLEIFLISILPISLIKFNVISPKFRLFLLAGVLILLFCFGSFQNRSVSFYSAAVPYSGAVIVVGAFLLLLARVMRNKRAKKWYKDPHFLFLFIPISFAQQFLFQGFILTKLNPLFGPLVAIVATSLIFGYMHTIYPKPLFSMALGIGAGLIFSTLYILYPNILVATIAHSILNFVAVYLGFFTLNSKGIKRKN